MNNYIQDKFKMKFSLNLDFQKQNNFNIFLKYLFENPHDIINS